MFRKLIILGVLVLAGIPVLAQSHSRVNPHSIPLVHGVNFNTDPHMGAVLHVHTSGSDTTGDGSQNNPYKTIQYAMDHATTGDTIKVAAGIYQENLTPPSGVTLLGGYNISDWSRDINEEITVIDGKGGAAASMYNIQNVTIDGFRITNATEGVYSYDCIGVVVSNNEIYGCQYDGLLIEGDYSNQIGGFVIANNIIHDNWAGFYEGAVDWHYPPKIIRNNLFYNNNYAIVLWQAWSLEMINNTVVYQSEYCIGFSFDPYSLLRNNIIAFNHGCGLRCDNSYDLQFIKHDYNDIFGNGTNYCDSLVQDTTEISDDPLFVNPTHRDYHLLPSSPCINGGHPDSIYNDPDGSRNDMGAFGGPGAADWKVKPLLHGDVNADGHIAVSDVVYLINYLFKGGPPPECPIPNFPCSDVNCDGKVTVSDVVYLINYLFKGGPPPVC